MNEKAISICVCYSIKQKKMDDALHDFAKHTRHTKAELDANVSLMARKYLASHLGGHETYLRVADDYDWVNARTHNPPLTSYHTDSLPNENAFVELMKKGWPEDATLIDASMPSLGAFSDSLFPNSQETWRPRAAFFIAHRIDHPHARALLNAVLGEGQSEEKMQSVSQRNLEHDVWMRMHEDGSHFRATPEEWGYILNGLTGLDDSIVVPKRPMEIATPEPVQTERFDENESISKEIEIANIAPALSKTHAEWAAHPLIDEWRREQLLSPGSDPKWICDQYAATHIGEETAIQYLCDYATLEQATELAKVHNIPRGSEPYTPADIVRIVNTK